MDVATLIAQGVMPICRACNAKPVDNISGWRVLAVDDFGNLTMSRDLGVIHQITLPSSGQEYACVCGQRHALALTERYLERNTFAPADFTPTPVEEPHYLDDNIHQLL